MALTEAEKQLMETRRRLAKKLQERKAAEKAAAEKAAAEKAAAERPRAEAKAECKKNPALFFENDEPVCGERAKYTDGATSATTRS